MRHADAAHALIAGGPARAGGYPLPSGATGPGAAIDEALGARRPDERQDPRPRRADRILHGY